ncbi:MAG TPA: hypothetical protein VFY29_13410 [Terriglobia bacterium]|nr:hypothetical protein [Terriglobia bacterium]
MCGARQAAVLLIIVFGLAAAPAWRVSAPALAADVTVSKDQFSRYIESWSEPEGFFDSDNFISNETSYLHVIGELKSRVREGGVYIGVGPDQNFSYIAHTKPVLAVIVDIRRQNMLEHLYYKALFEMSASRAEFVAALTGRKAPAVPRDAKLPDLLRAARTAPVDATPISARFAAVRTWLIDRDGLKLDEDDLRKIRYVMEAFALDGLDLRFSTIGRASSVRYPTYEELMVETDREGRMVSYLATEDSFQWMKRFETENRLIPIVGDFAGPKAFKAVGSFLKANSLGVSVFYTSNVEYYIFGGEEWARYLDNVRALPAAPDAVFIRAYFGNSQQHPKNMAGHRSTSLVDNLPAFLSDAARGRIQDYWDVVNR